MKHLLNDLSSEEKNRIREQYEGGMSVDSSKFKKLVETKLGDTQPLVNENFHENQKYQMFIDILTKMIDNFVSINCNNPTERYERMYCDNMSDHTLEDLEKKRTYFENKLSSSIYDEFYNKN